MPAARGGAELTCSPRLLRKPASHTAAGLSPDMCWISGGYLIAACSKAESAGCKQPASGTRQPFPRGRLAPASSGPGARCGIEAGRPRTAVECATNVLRMCYGHTPECATHVPRTRREKSIRKCYVPRNTTKCATHVPRNCEMCHACATMCHVCATLRSVHGWRPRPLAGGSHAAAGLWARRARLRPCAS